MKHLLFFILIITLSSCQTELSAEKYGQKAYQRCKANFAQNFLETRNVEPTDEHQNKLCDCYVNYITNGEETVTMNEIMERTMIAEPLYEAMDACIEMHTNNIKISAIDYGESAYQQCMSNFAVAFLPSRGIPPIDEYKEKLCDCYVDYFIGKQDSIRLGEIFEKANEKSLHQSMDDCIEMHRQQSK